MIRIILIVVLLLSYPAFAMEGMHHHHGDHMMMHKPKLAKDKKAAEWNALSAVMHKNMAVMQTNYPDADFVRSMIPHHQGAIDMANWVLKYGQDARVKKLAHRIIAAQTGEIAWMNRWLKNANQKGPKCNCAKPLTPVQKELAHINHAMHKNMDIPLSGDADQDFLKGMIPHHQGAIAMADWVRRHGRNPDINKLASDIIRAQRGEIARMQGWLN